MHQIFPKVNQVFSYHLSNFEVIESLMSSISLRVEAQEQYERAINKSAQKIIDLKSQHPLYSKIIKGFKSLISQRVSQVRFFKEQIASQAEQLKQALIPIEQQMRSSLSELKGMEKDLKSAFDTLLKNKAASESKLKQLDEKFILNEISVLYKQNITLRKNSESYLSQQKKMTKALEKDLKAVKQGITKFQIGARQKEKVIWELDFRVEEEFVDFFKKLNVHEISLIRNIQYDIDTMIKKTDLFNWQKTQGFEQQFSGNAIEQFEMSFKDPYKKFKKAIIEQESIVDEKAEVQYDEERLKQISAKLNNKQERQCILLEIEKHYSKCRDQVCGWIESFRKQGKFKFETQQFQTMTYIFKNILRYAIKHQDFECIQRIIQYGNSYCCLIGQSNRKKTILDQLKKEKILSDLSFWRYYLLWLIRQSVNQCKATEDRQIHIRNAVYTTLLSNSLSMIDWGIQKYSVKNCVGKMAKTFGSLTEAQIAELLRLTQAAYESHEKMKKNRKE